MLANMATDATQTALTAIKSPYLPFADALLWARHLRELWPIPGELIDVIVRIYHDVILPAFSCLGDSVVIAAGKLIFRRDFKPANNMVWQDIGVQRDIRGIASGKYFMIAWAAGGRYMKGDNRFGELGLGHSNTVRGIVFADDHSPIISAACGDRFTVVIREGGELFGWGQLPGYGVVAFPMELGISNV
jgi:hypothetical protein